MQVFFFFLLCGHPDMLYSTCMSVSCHVEIYRLLCGSRSLVTGVRVCVFGQSRDNNWPLTIMWHGVMLWPHLGQVSLKSIGQTGGAQVQGSGCVSSHNHSGLWGFHKFDDEVLRYWVSPSPIILISSIFVVMKTPFKSVDKNSWLVATPVRTPFALWVKICLFGYGWCGLECTTVSE